MNRNFISILIEPVSKVVDLSLIMQVWKMFTKESVCRFHPVRVLLQFFIAFCLLSMMSIESSMNEFVINCDLFVKSFWKLETFLHEIQSLSMSQNCSESHRIQKVAMLVVRKYILKSVDWSSIIIRYVFY